MIASGLRSLESGPWPWPWPRPRTNITAEESLEKVCIADYTTEYGKVDDE